MQAKDQLPLFSEEVAARAAEVQKQALLRAESVIAAAGFSYTLKHPDGRHVVYDPHELFVEGKVKHTRSPSKFPLGELSAYVKPYLASLKAPGDVVCIPAGKFDLKSVRSIASTQAGHMFGTAKENGGVTTHSTFMNVDKNQVEIILNTAPVSEAFLNARVEK
jgi:hypothetical protein